MRTPRLPHPLILLFGAVAIAAALTWVLPSGEFDRREDQATGRTVVVAGTYHAVPGAPVGPFAAAVSVPRGLIDGADVIALVLLAGACWFVVDKLGTLRRLVGGLVGRFRNKGLVAIPIVSLFFIAMGALENMQEEIIPLIPVLLVLGRGLRIDAVCVVAMSAGAAMIGSAFGPTNPFQAGIAGKLAQLPPTHAMTTRMGLFVLASVLWIFWTMRHALLSKELIEEEEEVSQEPPTTKDLLILLLAIAPVLVYVYGSLKLGWGFNELSAGFLIAGLLAGLLGGLRFEGTGKAMLEGMQSVAGAAALIGVARAISLVLADGHVIDTILDSMAGGLSGMSATVAAMLMVPLHAVIHVFVPTVSGQAVLTMPVLVPLADLIHLSRPATVFAYQMGAGLTELLTPTNGALMAILLSAKVPFGQWVKFAAAGATIMLLLGIVGLFLLR